MNKLITRLAVAAVWGALVVAPFAASAYTSVRGYYRSNGTYVQPYVRSSPNALRYDNYRYNGNGSLYNSTYYGSSRSYSPSWYQPSYNTDPSYYYGRSLYNSRRG